MYTSEVNPDIGIPESRDLPVTFFRQEFPTGKFSQFPVIGKKIIANLKIFGIVYLT